MRSKVDHYVYYKKVGEHFIYVVMYVMICFWLETTWRLSRR